MVLRRDKQVIVRRICLPPINLRRMAMDYLNAFEKIDSLLYDESSTMGECWMFIKAHIAELESQLAAMQRIVDGYKDDLKIPENVLGVLKLAYRKHHLLDDSVGSTELSDFLMDTICELIGDDGFQKWLDELECCNIVVE
ncbi:MAG TPA: hypothetical protein PLH32_18105 [bacterium]|nr:hypothetical protein [bacterium]